MLASSIEIAGHRDWIQRTVVARARELKTNANAISVATGGAVSPDHVQAYLTGKKSMTTEKLQHVLRVLKLEIKPFS